MSIAPIHESNPSASYDDSPMLELAYSEGSASFQRFNEYFELRDQAGREAKIDSDELAAIQADARSWAEQAGVLVLPTAQEERVKYYSEYDESKVRSKLGAFVDYLELVHGDKISDAELEATRLFIDATFDMYEDHPSDGDTMADNDGSFAFVVPARMSRDDSEYGEEVEPVIPALRYMPNELRAQMMVGLPPFVIDTYQYDDDTKRRGYLVLAPVYGDSAVDLESRSDQMNVARWNVNEAVNFAQRRFGVEVVGLGATLPSLTNYGRAIENKKVVTTTGHGGTAELISLTMKSGLQGREPESIGVLGLGAIGASVAEVVADRHPNIPIRIYDAEPSKVAKLAGRQEGRFSVAESGRQLVEESDVVISAITGRFELSANGVETLPGTLVIDDAQPASFDPADVEARGGSVVWVIGRDSRGTVASRTGYDYATLLDAQTDVFGCEAEAASISKYMTELRARGMGEAVTRRIAEKVALKRAVDPQAVRYISALFKKYDIIASEPQAFGRPVDIA